MRFFGRQKRADYLALPGEINLSGSATPRLKESSSLMGPRRRTARIVRSGFELIVQFLEATWRWLLLIALVAGLFIGGLAAWNFLLHSTFFDITEVELLGASGVTKAELLAVIEPHESTRNLIALSSRKLRDELVAMPRVRSARVEKIYPGVLRVLVNTRIPTAVITGDPSFLLDAEGIVLAEIRPDEWATLPQLPLFSGISGADVILGQPVSDTRYRELVRLHLLLKEANPMLEERIAEYHAGFDAKGFQLVFDGGCRVLLGDAPRAAQLAALEAYLDQGGRVERSAEIDLRFHPQIIYRTKELSHP